MIPLRRWLGLLVLAWVLDPRAGQAAIVESEGDCPRRADLDAALTQLLNAKADRPFSASVVVRDLGANWSVEVAGRSATYSDPGRDCSERTRVAAVFATLVLEPPDLGDTSASQPRRSQFHRLEVAPEFLVAPGSGERSSARTFAGSLRWLEAGEHLGLTAGLEASYPAALRVRGYGWSLARVALDASSRLSWRSGGVEFGVEGGPYAALWLAHGEGLFANASSTRLDAGGRLGLHLQSVGRRVSPFLAVQAEFSARHFSVVVDPTGNVGSAPSIWLGFLAGGSISLGRP
jgi:hypothetical protein